MSSLIPPENQARLAAQVKAMYQKSVKEAEEIGRQLNEASRKRSEAQIAELKKHYGPKTTIWQRIKEFLK